MTTECHFSQCKYHSCHEGDGGPFCYMDFDNLSEDAYCKILYKKLFKELFKENKMMNDKEFDEMLEKLWDIGLNDGDLGYKYWSKVVFKLKEMRKQVTNDIPSN